MYDPQVPLEPRLARLTTRPRCLKITDVVDTQSYSYCYTVMA